MPGILPMKVIKVGTTAQIRIAQACDRCRSKKIRCDGIRPCCSQCANVGFECKTSDKLSRRAFPRGYTESLEERVRVLEGEVRELKDLLDEKDEKIDMLSRMHNNRAASHSSLASSPVVAQSPEEPPAPKDDTFRLQASPLLLDSDTTDAPFMGASTGRTFVDAFKRKLRDNGKSCSGFTPTSFLLSRDFTPSSPSSSYTSSIPPRLFSDRCINIFWQEHAPLFPVLHKPTFLRLYEEYVANPEEVVDNHKLAMLHLVFSIAGFSTDLPDKEDIAHCEEQWRRSLNAILLENTLSTLQCLILACLYCSQTGDYRALQTYKAIAVGLSQRLGLHQSQKRFSFGALTIETRKKVFWTLYTVDCFSAASMGLPQLLQDSDIETEYPVAIDDEYVEEKGYLPTLPGQSSKISSALALFRASRILSKILQKLYPANPSQDLSLQAMSALEAELDEWSEHLPQHLKLTFVQDKPSTDVTGSRSALLSLAYYHIRSLLHRPAIGSTLGDKASPSVISLANSSKHLIQIIQLLEERSMSFSFCISKPEMLTLCGLSLLYQSLDLKKEGMLLRDGQRLIHAVSTYLDKLRAPGAPDFKKLVASLSPPGPSPVAPALPDRRASAPMAAPRTKSTPSPPLPRQMLTPASSRYTAQSTLDSELLQQQERMRRASLHSTTIPVVGLGTHGTGPSRALSLKKADASRSDEYRAGAGTPRQALQANGGASDRVIIKAPRSSTSPDSGPNLDYLPLHATPRRARNATQDGGGAHDFPGLPRKEPYRPSLAPSEWETLLSSLDSGASNIFDAVYGGPAAGMGGPASGHGHAAESAEAGLEGGAYGEWEVSPHGWDAATLGMGLGMGVGMGMGEFDAQPRSVLSFSEESLSSGDEFVGEFGMGGAAGGGAGGGGLLRAEMEMPGEGGFYLEGLEVGFGLS